MPRYDYYTGGPTSTPAARRRPCPATARTPAPSCRSRSRPTAPAPAFNLTALNAAFAHHADGTGVFESGQNPIIVGQAAYNSAYGTNFVSGGWCNAPTHPAARCDGFARITEQGGDTFNFNTLKAPNAKLGHPDRAKAIHDEMNSATFDEYGRMTANLGLEAAGHAGTAEHDPVPVREPGDRDHRRHEAAVGAARQA